jgi:hypothetical protein
MDLLTKYPEKINWKIFSKNSSIFDLDYTFLDKRCIIYKEELIQMLMSHLFRKYGLRDLFDFKKAEVYYQKKLNIFLH